MEYYANMNSQPIKDDIHTENVNPLTLNLQLYNQLERLGNKISGDIIEIMFKNCSW